MIDIILVGDKDSPITKACVASIEVSHYTNVVIVVPYDGYNRSLNTGAKKGFKKYIAFCNNDLEFRKDWDTHMIQAFKDNPKVHSASPWCPHAHPHYFPNARFGVHLGTHVRKHIAGWCIVMYRTLWERMAGWGLNQKGFDERQNFWCCDNSYQMQLEQMGEAHMLVTASEVLHLESQTLKTIKDHRYHELTNMEAKKFNRNWNQDLFNIGT